MQDSLLQVPPNSARTQFSEGFGQRVLLTVDTEEEFDWNEDFSSSGYGLDHVRSIAKFQEFAEGLGVTPVYLVDWPIVQSRRAREVLSEPLGRGKAEIGMQLHPWVNPPHVEEVNVFNSFAGNLPPGVERNKLFLLHEAIEKNLGCQPLIYRAGRYGLGEETAMLLKEAGIAIDSSVRSNFNYSERHGPDYSGHPLHPYWVDRDRQLLELPLTTVFWGLLRKQAPLLQPLARSIPRLGSALSKFSLLERIPLTPEGISLEEALRGIDIALDDGLPLLVLSFHSPSLMPGLTPYVRDEDDLDRLYDWFRGVYAYLAERGVKPTSVAEVMANVVV